MISRRHLKSIQSANKQLARTWEEVKKTHATGNTNAIEQAAMRYFQAVEGVYAAAKDAVAEKTHRH
jgi:hypothetical protein